MDSFNAWLDCPGDSETATVDIAAPVAPSATPPRFKPRRISAVRDFPIGCGSHAPRRSEEELRRLIDFSRRFCAKNQRSSALNPFPINPATAAAVTTKVTPPRKRPAEAADVENREAKKHRLGCDDRLVRPPPPPPIVKKEPLKPSLSLHLQSTNPAAAVTHAEVQETLRLFRETCERLLREEPNPGPGKRNRVDFKAAKILKNRWLNTGERAVGTVPGVEVGDVFRYRIELCMVGLHRRVMAGIDFKRLSNGDVLATCIVSSGYYDDKDVGKGGSDDDVLIYCGEGGDPKNPCGNRVAADQKLRGANLALKRSMERKLPVRVVRGFRTSRQERVISTYTYDGLYLVEKHWEVRGDNGYRVFKFQLRRIPGQPALSEVKRSRLEQAPLQYQCVVHDVSGGTERHPIRAMNAVNATRPIGFSYISRLRYPSWYDPRPPAGCGCIGGCADSSACACAAKNGGSFAYGIDGTLLETRPLVYECGPSCGCPPSCRNRASQSGVKVQLQVFNAGSRGWGVRSPNCIAAGAFVCEYVGEVITEREAGKRSNDEYLFDVGRNYGGGEACEEDSCFTIDAAEYGNVGRFINHSCSPNLYAQNVLFDHDDKRVPHVMLFALADIAAYEELAYDYNYRVDGVRDEDGELRRKYCYCGTFRCSGRMY